MPKAWSEEKIRQLIGPHAERRGGLLEALHALFDHFGYIEETALPVVADVFNLSRAEVHGVVSFYHDFRKSPPGRHVIKICQAEACQAVGSRELTRHAKKSLGIDFHENSKGGGFTLEPVYCLGNCAATPAVMVDGHVYGRVDPDRFDQIVLKYNKGSRK